MPFALVGGDEKQVVQRWRHLHGSQDIIRRADQARSARRGKMPAVHADIVAGVGKNHFPAADVVAAEVAVLGAVVAVIEDEILSSETSPLCTPFRRGARRRPERAA